jgi:hypothetical protein
MLGSGSDGAPLDRTFSAARQAGAYYVRAPPLENKKVVTGLDKCVIIEEGQVSKEPQR